MHTTNNALSLLLAATASIALTFGLTACNKNQTQTPDNSAQSQPAQPDQTQAQDPAAAANLAPASDTQTSAASDQNSSGNDSDSNYDADDQDSSYGQPTLEAPDPPPALPEYSQPECPGEGYLWTPGYWSHSSQGYYWVPGAWARPPEVGYLWTPGYWGYAGGRYRYYNGYWGRHIGYYGGVNYGFGYVGAGYQGGYWNGDRFNYNRSVNNVNVSNVQVYNRTVTNTVIINNTTVNVTNSRASYNGPGGVTRKPLPAEVAATREQRIPPMNTQMKQRQEAAQNRQQFASVNKGRPTLVAAAKPIPAGKPIAPVIPARAAAAPRPAAEKAQP
ncbi:MAG: YXWGXW repeat-containing protein, partial [Candidatus Sulfotelmatobacter sp.]